MSDTPKVDNSEVMLKGVRLSFPDLFQAKQFEGQGPASYSATFLIQPGSANDLAIRKAINLVATQKWGAKAPAILKTIEFNSQKFAYVDGNTKKYDGYEGMWALSTKRPQESGPPKVIDKDPKVELSAADGRIYGGCYVNGKVSAWAQDNKWGQGVRFTLIAVQFYADGDSFGGAPQANVEGFGEVEEEAEDLV